MTIQMLNINNKRVRVISTFIILLIIQVAITGCLENYGILKPSLEVDRMFVKLQVLPDHKYYYSGPDAIPDAIIGIHNSYTLDSRLWKPVDLTPEQIKKWLSWMTGDLYTTITNYGWYILDPSGKRVGVWFSPFYYTTIKMGEGNHIAVYTPIKISHRKERAPFGFRN
ncbi:MAG: hypothetical protein ABII68_02195 [Pseudomonadota bacterium]